MMVINFYKSGQNFLYFCPKISIHWSWIIGRDHLIDKVYFLCYNNEGGIEMKIEKDARQMPANREVTKEKNYCDLLYAWL